MIISIGAEKALDRIHPPFMIKTLQAVAIEGTYFNIIKAIYEQTESNNTLKGSYTMIKWDLSQGCKDSSIYANQSM